MTKIGYSASLSSEQKAEHNRKIREKYNSVSEEEKQLRKDKRKKREQAAMAKWSPERLVEYKQKRRERWDKFKQNYSPERKEQLRRIILNNNRQKYASLNPEEKEKRLAVMRLRNKNMAEQQRESERARHREDSRKRKIIIISRYSNGLMRCMNPNCEVPGGTKNIDALCIDHINGGGRKHTYLLKSRGTTFYKWLIDNSFPEGYQVLCSNCNTIKKIKNKEDRHK